MSYVHIPIRATTSAPWRPWRIFAFDGNRLAWVFQIDDMGEMQR